jgi:hypothetical protein
MSSQRPGMIGLGAALMLASAVVALGSAQQINLLHVAGSSVTGAFEGWFQNPDGTNSILIGYYNRNQAQEIDIPIGPDNRFDPGPADRGQPTHFLTGRRSNMFVVKVPKELPKQQQITWTLIVNGQTTSVPFYLHQDYEIDPFKEVAAGNTPAILSFDEKGPFIQGPLATMTERTTSAGRPLTLTAWVSDDLKFTSNTGIRPRSLDTRPPVSLFWSKYRGPGDVKIDKATPDVQKLEGGKAPYNGKATTAATFAEAGDYMLHVTVNDYSGIGGGGSLCCWTTGLVKVTVTP